MSKQFFEKSKEMNDIVRSICQKRADLFPYIDPSMIECSLRTDKSAPSSCKWVIKIKGIRGPMTSVTDKKYLIYGYESLWRFQSLEQKIAHIAYCLKQILVPTKEELEELKEKEEEWEWGKVEPPDFISFKTFVIAFGLDWEVEPNLPNILEDPNVAV